MFKFLKLFFASLLLISVSSIFAFCADEKITITAFYPSPYGSYKELAVDEMKVGVNYAGVGVSAVGSGLIVEGNVGIGTPNPGAKLVVSGGSVGIGTDNPQAMLDVAGGIRLGFDSDCSPAKAGIMRYNAVDGAVQYCDGDRWQSIGGSSGPSKTYYCFNNDVVSSYGTALIPVCTDAGGTQGYCPSGYTQKLYLGEWGQCYNPYGSIGGYFLPPGGTCNPYSPAAIGGKAYVCSK